VKELVLSYIMQYGYGILFFAFLLELLALPLPGEFILAYVGYLTYQNHMNFVASILVVFLGVCTGITISYYLGYKLGKPFVYKYGHYVYLSPKRLDLVSGWFGTYGYIVLVVAYFIPGVRHVTGYFSGITQTPIYKFHIHAYLGAFLYTIVFISLGRVLGPNLNSQDFDENYITIGAVIILTMLIIYLVRKYAKLYTRG
jgi:membrane protein DedA with SNARE-associated domain